MSDESGTAVKRPLSAYLLFMSEFREEYKRVNSEGFKKVTEVAKAGAIKWGALTPEEKKPYEEDAAQRKSEFLKMHPDPIPRRRKANAKDGKKMKKAKKAKDPNAPKRPLSAYLLFMNDFREEYMTSHPETKKVSEVAKAGAAKWGTLTPEMKHPYEQQAAIKKNQYEEDKKAYEMSKM